VRKEHAVNAHPPSRVASPSPLQVIRDALPALTGAKRRVAELILADPAAAGAASITALAEGAGTHPAAISRLSTLLGYSGYPSLRAAVASESGRQQQAAWQNDIGTEIDREDSPEQVLSVLAGRQFGSVRDAMSSIDLPAMVDLAERIVAAGRVHIFAEWGDLPPALELHMRLYRIGIPVWLDQGAHAAGVGARQLERDDVAIAISRSGEGAIAARYFELARRHGGLTVLITGSPNSPLAADADTTIFTGTGYGTTWTDYFAGRMSDSLTAGLLWMLVAQRVHRSFEASLALSED
jgi:DNA-binding MurR/RpiR family transcriptional regulator